MARRWCIVFLAFAILLYLAAPLISSNFAYLLASLYLLAALLLWPAPRPDVAVELLFPARLTAGRPATVTARLRGRMKLPRFVLVAELLLPEALRAALEPQAWQLRFLPAGPARGLAAVLTPPRRGVYACGGLRLTAYGFAGLAAPPQLLGSASELIVHPRVIAELPVRELLAGRITALGQRYIPARAGEEFHALREYRPGDPLRRIHWRTTARTGELMVVVAETLVLEVLDIWFDTESPAGPAFEYNVRLAATIVDHLTATTGCSLRAGAARREPGMGEHAQLAMLDILARVNPGEPAALPAANAIIITVPGAAYAGAPPPTALVIVNDLWDTAAAAAPGVVRLTAYGLVRDDRLLPPAPVHVTGHGAR